jgi:hypothetical protein
MHVDKLVTKPYIAPKEAAMDEDLQQDKEAAKDASSKQDVAEDTEEDRDFKDSVILVVK